MESIKQALEELSANRLSIADFFKFATESITREVGSTRASVWSFNTSGDKIFCLDLYDTREEIHGGGIVLEKLHFPEYFEAIHSNAVVRAPVAATHPDTKCFQELYFKPNDIHSLLDFVIANKSSAIGILCCEHCGEVKEWTDEQVDYLEQIAFSIGFAISIAQRRAAA